MNTELRQSTGPMARPATGELTALLARLEAKVRHEDLTEHQLADVRQCLERLESALSRHFADEESGLFGELAARAPRMNRRIERLRREHRALMGLLQRLVLESLERSTPFQAAAFCDEASRFARRLRRHERTEGRLIQESMGFDLGVGG